jgi:hypothetical protein
MDGNHEQQCPHSLARKSKSGSYPYLAACRLQTIRLGPSPSASSFLFVSFPRSNVTACWFGLVCCLLPCSPTQHLAGQRRGGVTTSRVWVSICLLVCPVSRGKIRQAGSTYFVHACQLLSGRVPCGQYLVRMQLLEKRGVYLTVVYVCSCVICMGSHAAVCAVVTVCVCRDLPGLWRGGLTSCPSLSSLVESGKVFICYGRIHTVACLLAWGDATGHSGCSGRRIRILRLSLLRGIGRSKKGVDSLLPGLARLPAAARAAGVFVGGKTSPAGPGVGTWAGV